MNDFVNKTAANLSALRDDVLYDEDYSPPPEFLEAIDNALAVLNALTYHWIFPATRETCESIVKEAQRRSGK